jgi:hypothetical protein
MPQLRGNEPILGLNKITKEWSGDLLVPTDPADMFDVDSPETAPDTAGPRKIKKTEEVQI